MRSYTHGSNSRPATAVGNAEGLVQVEMAHVGTEVTRLRDANQGVEVGAIHVHLTSVGMHEVADLTHSRFEDAVGRWICDHERSQPIARSLTFRAEVGDIDVALAVAGNDHHIHSCHDCTRGVGAVGARGNEAHRPS